MIARYVLSGLCACFFAAALAQQASSAENSVCPVGSQVLVDPGGHRATVLANTAVSCRVHYEDGAFADGWVQGFLVRAADADAKAAAATKNPPPPGKYTCGVFLSGHFTFTQYVTLSPGEYTSSTAGTGKYRYDAATKRLLFDTGKFEPLFGSYEPTPAYPMFRLSARNDMKESDYTRSWRSQICSGKY